MSMVVTGIVWSYPEIAIAFILVSNDRNPRWLLKNTHKKPTAILIIALRIL